MRGRPLIGKTAAQLGAAVGQNKRNKEALDNLVSELRHRKTPSAKRILGEAERYLEQLSDRAMTEETRQVEPESRVDSAEMLQRRQWTLEAIKDLRSKLIDLSKRNPLISFKHSERGATYLRFVDERPDRLFGILVDGEMRFEPLPDEDVVPADEQSDDFLIALERRRLTDPDYLAAIDELGDEESDASALQAAERQLRAKAREDLGLPKPQFGKTIDIKALARAHGFDPSFELSDTDDDGDEAHHRDDKIRVLLTEKQLERRLSTIHDRYRGHERETGLHTLFLVFGFAEWFEDDDSELALHAPALLLPVHLERTLKRGRYVFTISARDEDLQVNVAMRELLRQRFGLEAPELRAGETPESYFIRLSGLLEETNRFRLKRFVTLAVLPFPRMVLWQDLDPEQWPEHAFSSHDLLVRLLGAEGSGGAPAFGEDYPIDEPTLGKVIPPLITEADVSQHSALIDVAAGIPLALEGPPGTGKSQTITNMIAAALDKNKKVLFIAEKQAALGVVAARLRKHGFGPLLLELHSDRATKTGLIESLRERVDARIPNDARNLDALRRDLESQRTQLRTYLSLLGEPLGSLGRTAHQLIWRYLNLRQGIDDAAIVAGESKGTLDDALSIDASTLQRRREILDQIGIKLQEHVEAYGTIDGNAWTRAANIDVLHSASLLSAMRDVAARADALYEMAGKVRNGTKFPLSDDVQIIGTQAAQMRDVAEPPPTISDEQLKSVLSEPEEAERLLNDQIGWCSSAEAVSMVGVDVLSLDEDVVDELEAALDAVKDADDARTVRATAASERLGHQTLRALADEARALGDRLGLNGEALKIGQLHAICAVLVERNDASEVVRTLCRSKILDEAFPAILPTEAAAAGELRERFADIADHISPDGFACPPSELERIAAELEGAGWFRRLFSGEFKRDRQRAEGILGSFADRVEAGSRLRALRQLLIDEDSFTASSPIRSYFTEALWAGSKSNWDAITDARALAERSYDRLANIELDHLCGHILDATSLELRALTGKAQALAEPIASLPQSEHGATFSEMLAAIDASACDLERLVKALSKLDVSDDALLRKNGYSIVDALRAFRFKDSEFRNTARPTCLAWASIPTEPIDELKQLLDYRSGLESDVLATLERSEAPRETVGKIKIASTEVLQICAAWTEAKTAFEKVVKTDLLTFLACGNDVSAIAHAARRIGDDEPGLRLAADFKRYIGDAERQDCAFAVALATARAVASDRLSDFYELLVSSAILSHYLQSDGAALKRLGGLTLGAIRDRFRSIDSELQEVEAKRIVAQRLSDRSIWGRDSGPKGTWTEGALINNELSKKKRHIPIRDLTKRAGRALQAMKPVWMMSPSSVAQYVQPGTVTFDLIVIDEASQMRPEYAVSSILRGDQLVVVGDSRQLPPTDFFQTTLAGMDANASDDDDEEALTVDTESILDLANSRIGTRRQLNWHYRSRHESLIQFSNRQFYDRRLVVFPSPDTDNPLLGVKHCFVGGTYEASINQEEAEAVIRDAIGLMIAHPECSMGIATMNIKQTELIKAEFDRLAGEQEVVRNYIAAFEGGIDRFFIKNLENVQGDERDIILISTVYGPDKNGRVMQRFGPIASEVGHRRLNVLVTRARLSTRVYTSLRSGDIKIVETSKPGNIATQAYLTYAEGGAQFELSEGHEADSDFELFVADRLRGAGFEVIHQVGVEKFRIDLGVRHPDYPLGFIAGVECDGASYHSGFTVRDRDRIRQAVLEDLGWNIYRIWSTDWFTDPDREAAKLISRLVTWRDEAVARFRARYDSGEFRETEILAPSLQPKHDEIPQSRLAAKIDEPSGPAASEKTPEGPRELPEGRKRELEGIDWYEVETAKLYEVWPDGEFGGEVEVLSRATGAPQIYGGSVRIPKSEYRGTVEATGASFIENDIYAAVRKVGQLARAARADATG